MVATEATEKNAADVCHAVQCAVPALVWRGCLSCPRRRPLCHQPPTPAALRARGSVIPPSSSAIMFLYLTSRIVRYPSFILSTQLFLILRFLPLSCIAAFLYPGYASFKTLSQRPASEEDLERWLMYWSVLACVVGVEYLAEWLVSWCALRDTSAQQSCSPHFLSRYRIPFYYLF